MQNKNLRNSEHIIEELLSGELSEHMVDKIHGWMAKDADRPDKEAAFRKAYYDRVYFDPNPKKEAYVYLKESHRRLGFPDATVPRKSLLVSPFFRVAAVFLTVLLIGGITLLSLNNQTYDNRSYISYVSSSEADQEMVLPDGTRVMLRGSSTFGYENDFESHRRVKLDGEAFFSVVKNSEKPFTVETSSLEITVLGTEFNVKAHSAHQNAEVTLASGSVKVLVGDKDYLISPMSKLSYDKISREVSFNDVSRALVQRMTRKPLTFEDSSLKEVLGTIEEYYETRIVIEADVPLDRRIRIQFGYDDNIDDVMFALKNVAGDFDYRIENGNVRVIKVDSRAYFK